MIVNRKLDRFKQWGKERMGSDAKTVTSADFKALETEMQLRHDGKYMFELAPQSRKMSVTDGML
jgi:hypothetical protein